MRQIQADLDPQALHTYGLSANDVINALAAQNLVIPAGTEKIGTYEYKVNLNNSPTAIEAFNQLPIKTVNGTVVYMRDVAHVHDGSPPQTSVVHVAGKPAVLLSIIKTGSASTLDIINGIKRAAARRAADRAGRPRARHGRRPVAVGARRGIGRGPRGRHRRRR